MGHGPSTEWGEDKASSYKSRIGLWMFLVYCIVYAGFVIISAVRPKLMEQAVGSLNWAVAYGFGLIGLALIMAVIYNYLSGKAEKELNGTPADE